MLLGRYSAVCDSDLPVKIIQSLELDGTSVAANRLCTGGCRYAQRMAAEVGSADALVPPLPPLTRYKREVAVKAAATDTGSAPATPPRSEAAPQLLPHTFLVCVCQRRPSLV